ncbi:MAG: metal-dependent hydrolase [Pseudomonadota bacterium]|nr:metal-dependent hydrolase [Pseudomonadota bacterium]
MADLTVRRPNFEFPQDLPIMPDPQDRAYSAMCCALTIIVPHLERYLIRTMKTGLKEVTDPALLQDMKDFSSQEANHFRNHDALNELLRNKLSDKARDELIQTEADLIEDYRRFSNTKSLRFNLAYAEGFESATCALSLWGFEHETFKTLHDGWEELIEWHLAEEIEHRTVAFVAYHALGGNNAHRMIWGT